MAKTPEVFTYDLDKNLQKDGRWEYSWNSLNQLEKMSLIPTATGTGKARHQVWTFVYDAQGRRVAKRFYEKFGADFAAGAFPEDYYLLEETLFFYDGWNLIAEVNAFTGDMKTYLWGTDLSGTFQGAGGVGGLLAIKDWKTNKTYAVLSELDPARRQRLWAALAPKPTSSP